MTLAKQKMHVHHMCAQIPPPRPPSPTLSLSPTERIGAIAGVLGADNAATAHAM